MAVLLMRGDAVGLGVCCDTFCVCVMGIGLVRAAFACGSGIDFHAYAWICGFHGAVPMTMSREFLSKI